MSYGDHRDFWRPTVREETCLVCKNRDKKDENHLRFYCKKTKRLGRELRGLRCPYFEKE